MAVIKRRDLVMRVGAVAVGFCLSVIWARPVLAFKTDVHIAITEEALRASSVTPWEFSWQVRSTLHLNNFFVDYHDHDLPSFLPIEGTQLHHFDDNQLAAGAAYALVARRAVIKHLELAEAAMAPGSSVQNAETVFEEHVKSAHIYLAFAHHAIQDFYSHSNWVELQQPGVAPMLWLGGKGGNPFRPYYGPASCTCGQLSNDLVTGRYGSNAEMVSAARDGMCIHGPAELEDGSSAVPGCPADVRELPGLNKDWLTASRFGAAYLKAVLATAGFTQGIVYEARDKRLYVALCGFLGYDDSRNCLRQTEPFEVEVTPPLTFTQFSAGAYKTAEVFSLTLPKFDGNLGQLRGLTTKWEVVVDGTATCPPDPGAVVSGATQCHLMRRITPITLTSPDIGSHVVGLTCNSQSGGVSVCGFPDFFDGYGFDVFTWSGGTYNIDEESDRFRYEREFRFLAPGAAFVGDANETFRVDGAFTTRALFYLGYDDEYFFYEPRHVFSFTGDIKIRGTITYEYVEDATAQ